MVIGSWLTRRLERVSSAVEAVAKGDLRRRVVDSSDDELGKSSQAFDTMADKLARRLSEERALRTPRQRGSSEEGCRGHVLPPAARRQKMIR